MVDQQYQCCSKNQNNKLRYLTVCLSRTFPNESAGKVVSRESTLGSRALPQKQFQTPAPGEYDIDKLVKSKLQAGGCIRGYTFGHPNVNHRSSRTPGKFNSLFFDSKL